MKIDRINPKVGYSPDNCIATRRIYYYRVTEWSRDVKGSHFYIWSDNAHLFYPSEFMGNWMLVTNQIATALIKYK